MALIEGHAGEQAVAALSAFGTDVMFTLNGGHIWPLYDAARNQGMRVIDTRHEQSATFAAEAYAKLTRRPGFAALTAGPGITNGVSAVTSAHFNGSPVVVLGGRAPQGRWGAGSLQELDHVPILASITKSAATVTDPEQAGAMVHEAARLAIEPHRGPTFLDFPLDVFGPSSGDVPASRRRHRIRCGARSRRRGCARRVDRGRAASGVHRGFRRVLGRRLGRTRRCGRCARCSVLLQRHGSRSPACRSRRWRSCARGGCSSSVPTSWWCSARHSTSASGSGRSARRPWPTWSTPSRSALATSRSSTVVGNITATLAGLADHAGDRVDHTDWIAELRDAESRAAAGEVALMEADGDPIKPSRIYGELRRRLERDAVVICDGGDFASYAGKFIEVFEPGGWLDTGPYGCLGNGLGYAIAARVVRPSSQVVLLLGDGAAGFSLMDVDSLVRHGLPVVMIVGNNGMWGLEKHPMQAIYGWDMACDLQPGCRYDEVVKSLGGGGETVSSPAEIGPALDRAFASGVPYLVNVLTDPTDIYPRSSNLA